MDWKEEFWKLFLSDTAEDINNAHLYLKNYTDIEMLVAIAL